MVSEGLMATAIQVDENTFKIAGYWNVGHCGTSPSSQRMQAQSFLPRSLKNGRGTPGTHHLCMHVQFCFIQI